MGCKRKKKQTQQNKPKQTISQFKEFLSEALKLIGKDEYFHLIKESEFERMSIYMLKPTRPVRCPNHAISSKELQKINDLIQIDLRFRLLELEDFHISAMEYNSLFALGKFLERYPEGKEQLAPLRSIFCKRIDLEAAIEEIIRHYRTVYFRTMFFLGNPKRKYYSFKINMESSTGESFFVKVNSTVSVLCAQSKKLMIHGFHRPVFRLGSPIADNRFMWLTVPAELVGNHYKGEQIELGLYIQSHAINRLKERLDSLDVSYMNFYLWNNTFEIESFEYYRGYLLLPFVVYGVKLGYLAANVIEDKLVFRTFLFLTHNCTPEGDRLKEISGLQKQDIKYWHFDRLSTLVAADVEKNPAMFDLFKEVGMVDLLKLKDLVDKPEEMHDKFTEGIIAYMEQGRKELEEADLPVASH